MREQSGDSLRELTAAVEAGVFPGDETAEGLGLPAGEVGTAYRAFSGSLDAAAALREAMLPGWRWSVYVTRSGASVLLWDSLGRPKAGDGIHSTNPGRALLLAILRAKLALMEARHG